MIRKLLITGVALLYLGISTGATLHFEYCMGQLVKVSLSDNHKTLCGTCGMDKRVKTGAECCTDQQQQFKAAENSLHTQSHLSAPAPFALLLNRISITFLNRNSDAAFITTLDDQLSTVVPKNPSFLLNRVFRI